MVERRPESFTPKTTSIAIVSPYPEGFPGGVQTVTRQLREDLIEMGFANTSLHTPDMMNRQNGDRKDAKAFGRSLQVNVFGTRAYLGFPDFKSHRDVSNAEIVHGHEPAIDGQQLVTFLSRRIYGRFSPNRLNIGTLHAFNASDAYLYTFKPIAKAIEGLQVADLLTVVSEPLKRRLEKFFPGFDIVVVPNGVDTKVFTPEGPKLKEFDDGVLNFGFVGRLEDRKGVHFAVDAVAEVAKTHDNFRFLIGGSGPDKEMLIQKVKELNLEKFIVFLGRVSDEDLPAFYRTLDVGFFPAYRNESFGIVLLEAMASGVPVIAGNNEGYMTLVSDGENGMVVDPKNIQQMTEVIKNAIDNPDLWRYMGSTAREISLEYDRKAVAHMYLDAYSKAHDIKQRRLSAKNSLRV